MTDDDREATYAGVGPDDDPDPDPVVDEDNQLLCPWCGHEKEAHSYNGCTQCSCENYWDAA